jgi:hypothetical protein
MQRRSRHRGRPLSAVATFVLIGAFGALAAACSSSPSGRTVASLPGTPSSAGAQSASASSTGSYDQDIVNYTHCLRAHGVNEPDPVNETHNGRTGLSFVAPPANAANSPALAACNHFIANLMGAKEAGASHELARWLPSLVRYASCMRSHDVPMLDPGRQGQLNLGNVPGITSDFGRYSPQFRSADAACRHFLPAGVHDDGTGP